MMKFHYSDPGLKDPEAFERDEEIWRAILNDASLSSAEKIRRLRPYNGHINKYLTTAQMEKRRIEGLMATAKLFIEWTEKSDLNLERNEHSRLHKLREFISDPDNIFIAALDEKRKEFVEYLSSVDWSEVQTFLVQHDWAAAFKGATDYQDGDVKLPYELAAFEFRISGKTVIVLSQQVTEKIWFMPFVGDEDRWWLTGSFPWDEPNPTRWYDIIKAQVKALSIAIDAQVATHKVVRASAELNAKREKKGKLRLFDYHIVSLNRTSRAEPLPGSGGTHRSPRLHFRRGHWRHYESFKTWVKWTLAGDPDLGFIDKHYKL